jgi:hypothetical protein
MKLIQFGLRDDYGTEVYLTLLTTKQYSLLQVAFDYGEYEKLARNIDNCENVEELQISLKAMLKLYMKQQEVTAEVLKMRM